MLARSSCSRASSTSTSCNCRRFRQTLLCHEGVAIDRQLGPEKVAGFRLSTRRRMQVGEHGPGEPLQGDEALPRAVLDALDDAAPRALTIDEIAARVPGSEKDYLRRLIWAAACAGAGSRCTCVRPTSRPSPGSARSRARWHECSSSTARTVTSLYHEAVRLDEEIVRRLVPLLDGTRDCAALAAALGEPPDAIDARLRHLAKLALLVA